MIAQAPRLKLSQGRLKFAGLLPRVVALGETAESDSHPDSSQHCGLRSQSDMCGGPFTVPGSWNKCWSGILVRWTFSFVNKQHRNPKVQNLETAEIRKFWSPNFRQFGFRTFRLLGQQALVYCSHCLKTERSGFWSQLSEIGTLLSQFQTKKTKLSEIRNFLYRFQTVSKIGTKVS